MRYILFILILSFSQLGYSFQVDINPQNFTGSYIIAGKTSFVSGQRQIELDPGQYTLGIAFVGSAIITIDANGFVSSNKPNSFVGGQQSITFNNSQINVVLPAGFQGQYWFARVGAGYQSNNGTFTIVPGLGYRILIGSIGNIDFFTDDNGNIISSNTESSVSYSGNTLSFNISTITIDPKQFTGNWTVSRVTSLKQGLSNVNIVKNIDYRIVVGEIGNIDIKINNDGVVASSNKPNSINILGSIIEFKNEEINIRPSIGALNYNIAKVSQSIDVETSIVILPDLDYRLVNSLAFSDFSIDNTFNDSSFNISMNGGSYLITKKSNQPQSIDISFNNIFDGSTISGEVTFFVSAIGGTINLLTCYINDNEISMVTNGEMNINLNSNRFADGTSIIKCDSENTNNITASKSINITIDNIPTEDEDIVNSMYLFYDITTSNSGYTCSSYLATIQESRLSRVKEECKPFIQFVDLCLGAPESYRPGPWLSFASTKWASDTPQWCIPKSSCPWYKSCGGGINWGRAWKDFSSIFSRLNFSDLMKIVNTIADLWDSFTWSGALRLLGEIAGVLGDLGIIPENTAKDLKKNLNLIADLISVGSYTEAFELAVNEITKIDDTIDRITNVDRNILDYLDDNASLLAEVGLVPQNTIDDIRSNIGAGKNILDGNYLEGGTTVIKNINENIGALVESVLNTEGNSLEYLNRNLQLLNNRQLIDDTKFQDFSMRLNNIANFLDLGDEEAAFNEITGLQVDFTGIVDNLVNLDEAIAYDGLKNALIEIKNRFDNPDAFPSLTYGLILYVEGQVVSGKISNGTKKKVNALLKDAIGSFAKGDPVQARIELKLVVKELIFHEIDDINLIEKVTSLIDSLDIIIGDSGDLPEHIIPALLNLTKELKGQLKNNEIKQIENHVKNSLKHLIIGEKQEAISKLNQAIDALRKVKSDVSSYIISIQLFIDEIVNFNN